MDRDNIVSELKAERDRLNDAIAVLEGSAARRNGRRASSASAPRKRRRSGMTAASRAKISRLMKQRWAERKKAGKTTL